VFLTFQCPAPTLGGASSRVPTKVGRGMSMALITMPMVKTLQCHDFFPWHLPYHGNSSIPRIKNIKITLSFISYPRIVPKFNTNMLYSYCPPAVAFPTLPSCYQLSEQLTAVAIPFLPLRQASTQPQFPIKSRYIYYNMWKDF
jgi:hypothetical protein